MFYLTPALFEHYRRLLGGPVQVEIDGIPMALMLEAFVKYVNCDTQAKACILCEESMEQMTDIGCIVGLFDAALMEGDEGDVSMTIWACACNACHDKAPETAQRRLLLSINDHAGGGEVIISQPQTAH